MREDALASAAPLPKKLPQYVPPPPLFFRIAGTLLTGLSMCWRPVALPLCRPRSRSPLQWSQCPPNRHVSAAQSSPTQTTTPAAAARAATAMTVARMTTAAAAATTAAAAAAAATKMRVRARVWQAPPRLARSPPPTLPSIAVTAAAPTKTRARARARQAPPRRARSPPPTLPSIAAASTRPLPSLAKPSPPYLPQTTTTTATIRMPRRPPYLPTSMTTKRIPVPFAALKPPTSPLPFQAAVPYGTVASPSPLLASPYWTATPLIPPLTALSQMIVMATPPSLSRLASQPPPLSPLPLPVSWVPSTPLILMLTVVLSTSVSLRMPSVMILMLKWPHQRLSITQHCLMVNLYSCF